MKKQHDARRSRLPEILLRHEPKRSKTERRSPAVVAAGQGARGTLAAALMTREVIVAYSDMSLEAVAELLVENGISGVPVVDDERRPLGMVTKTDLVRAHYGGGGTAEESRVTARATSTQPREIGPGFHEDPSMGVTARELMTPLVVTISEKTSLQEAAAIMTNEGIHRLPVVDGEGRIVGILSTFDVIRWVAAAEL